ncbi:MAG: helix-turn-helix domain-containing protein, partial [Actinobacteria bacterium]|nr:helix-turn-helix domain-containing protein [Actinomycetota bacterium]
FSWFASSALPTRASPLPTASFRRISLPLFLKNYAAISRPDGCAGVGGAAEALPRAESHHADLGVGACEPFARAIVRAVVGDDDDQGVVELARLLDGRTTTLDGLGRRAAGRPCVVVAVAFAEAARDAALERQRQRDAARVIGLQTAALRAGARHAVVGDRVYVLLPDIEDAQAAVTTVQATVAALRRHVDRSAHAAIGPVAATAAAAAASRRGADLALTAATAGGVTRFDAVRPALLVAAVLELVAARTELLDPELAEAAGADAAAGTLATYLAAGSDVTATAERLGVHPTTVRYRLRRIADRTGLDLDDPDVRLATELQLRATAGGR